jgi:energy-coupling factor transport system permease protein
VPDLVASLGALRLPPQFGYVLASTLMLAPIISARLHKVREAQESRGLVVEQGLVNRLKAARLQMVPLVLGLVHDAGIRAQALDARGFRRAGPRTSYREVNDSTAQRVFRLAVLLLAGAAVALRIVASTSGGGLA